ncbi:serine hydrolase domain-containing protein [Spirosoma aerolatum]|uniref:serine hydrolase domain-containing protein n=1 Tax=Spirosoma aerolatum TaxID=1211326 RepID=UPI0009ABC9C9|nr:serine hydrolase domain-containing protein [Spirosoma aerolatum]
MDYASSRKSRFGGLLALLFLIQTSWAQTASSVPADSVDAIVQSHMRNKHIPGVSIAVVRQGAVVLSKGYGLANVELNVSATPQSVYAIASVSKQFIASGILILAQEGKLSLDDDIHTYYPQAPQTWQGITLRHLLSHTSGIVREAPAFDPSKIQPDSVVVQSAFPLPLQFPIGTKWQYCNVGYFALADIIRKVSGQPWSTFLKDRIFKPAGMTATRTTTLSEVVPNRVDGYEWEKDHLQRAIPYRALRPSGAFLSTVLDLAKWEAALGTTKILTETSQKEMQKPFILKDGTPYPYGLGWRVDTLMGTSWIHHGGSLPGFRTEYARFPQAGLAVIVLTNSEQALPEQIAKEIATLYLRSTSGKLVTGK